MLHKSGNIVSLGRVQVLDTFKFNLFQYASEGRANKIVQMFSTCSGRDISIDVCNTRGQTALFVSCLTGNLKCVTTLLHLGADANRRSDDGSTPTHAAAFSCRCAILRVVVEHGGDLRLHDDQDRLPRDWAVEAGSKKSKKVLELIDEWHRDVVGSITSTKSSIHVDHARDSAISLTRSLQKGNGQSSRNSSFMLLKQGYGDFVLVPGVRRGLHQQRELGYLSIIPLFNKSHLTSTDTQPSISYQAPPCFMLTNGGWGSQHVTIKKYRKLKRTSLRTQTSAHDLLIAELNINRLLRHENILLLMGVCTEEWNDNCSNETRGKNFLMPHCFIYEQVSYGSMYHILHEKSYNLSIMESISILLQVKEALSYLHQRNYIHCCMSSHAVHLVNLHTAKLSDFYYTFSSDNFYQSQHHISPAFNRWLAPEILAERKATFESDIYGLCVVICEFVTGILPWRGFDPDSIRHQIVSKGRVLEIPDGIPTSLCSVLTRGLSLSRHKRTVQLKEIAFALRIVLKSDDILKLDQTVKSETILPVKQSTYECDGNAGIDVPDAVPFISSSIDCRHNFAGNQSPLSNVSKTISRPTYNSIMNKQHRGDDESFNCSPQRKPHLYDGDANSPVPSSRLGISKEVIPMKNSIQRGMTRTRVSVHDGREEVRARSSCFNQLKDDQIGQILFHGLDENTENLDDAVGYIHHDIYDTESVESSIIATDNHQHKRNNFDLANYQGKDLSMVLTESEYGEIVEEITSKLCSDITNNATSHIIPLEVPMKSESKVELNNRSSSQSSNLCNNTYKCKSLNVKNDDGRSGMIQHGRSHRGHVDCDVTEPYEGSMMNKSARKSPRVSPLHTSMQRVQHSLDELSMMFQPQSNQSKSNEEQSIKMECIDDLKSHIRTHQTKKPILKQNPLGGAHIADDLSFQASTSSFFDEVIDATGMNKFSTGLTEAFVKSNIVNEIDDNSKMTPETNYKNNCEAINHTQECVESDEPPVKENVSFPSIEIKPSQLNISSLHQSPHDNVHVLYSNFSGFRRNPTIKDDMGCLDCEPTYYEDCTSTSNSPIGLDIPYPSAFHETEYQKCLNEDDLCSQSTQSLSDQSISSRSCKHVGKRFSLTSDDLECVFSDFVDRPNPHRMNKQHGRGVDVPDGNKKKNACPKMMSKACQTTFNKTTNTDQSREGNTQRVSLMSCDKHVCSANEPPTMKEFLKRTGDWSSVLNMVHAGTRPTKVQSDDAIVCKKPENSCGIQSTVDRKDEILCVADHQGQGIAGNSHDRSSLCQSLNDLSTGKNSFAQSGGKNDTIKHESAATKSSTNCISDRPVLPASHMRPLGTCFNVKAGYPPVGHNIAGNMQSPKHVSSFPDVKKSAIMCESSARDDLVNVTPSKWSFKNKLSLFESNSSEIAKCITSSKERSVVNQMLGNSDKLFLKQIGNGNTAIVPLEGLNRKDCSSFQLESETYTTALEDQSCLNGTPANNNDDAIKTSTPLPQKSVLSFTKATGNSNSAGLTANASCLPHINFTETLGSFTFDDCNKNCLLEKNQMSSVCGNSATTSLVDGKSSNIMIPCAGKRNEDKHESVINDVGSQCMSRYVDDSHTNELPNHDHKITSESDTIILPMKISQSAGKDLQSENPKNENLPDNLHKADELIKMPPHEDFNISTTSIPGTSADEANICERNDNYDTSVWQESSDGFHATCDTSNKSFNCSSECDSEGNDDDSTQS